MLNLEVMKTAFTDELEKISFAVTEKGHKFDAERHALLAQHSADLDELAQRYGGQAAEGKQNHTFMNAMRFGDDAEQAGMHRHHEYVSKAHAAGHNAWNPLGGVLTPSSHETGGSALMLGKITPKTAEDLTAKSRADLPKKDFAVSAKKSNTGEKAYPIPDRRHAASALGFAKMHGDSADLAAVRAKIKAKFPDMLSKEKSAMSPVTVAAFAKEAAGLLGRAIGHFAEGPAAHKAELAGLGVLAAPVGYEMQKQVRGGDKGGAISSGAELAGLGILAAPAAGALLRH
jgi:hypothetical protein